MNLREGGVEVLKIKTQLHKKAIIVNGGRAPMTTYFETLGKKQSRNSAKGGKNSRERDR